MKRLDRMAVRIAMILLRWRFPVFTVHVTTVSEPVFDVLLGEDIAECRNFTRSRSRTKANVIRYHIDGLLDSIERLNDKCDVADLIHEIENTPN